MRRRSEGRALFDLGIVCEIEASACRVSFIESNLVWVLLSLIVEEWYEERMLGEEGDDGLRNLHSRPLEANVRAANTPNLVYLTVFQKVQ